MIPSLELIGRTMAMLSVMKDSGDFVRIESAINHLSTAGNMILDHIEKHDCKNCPSYGKGINNGNSRRTDEGVEGERVAEMLRTRLQEVQ